MLVNSFCFFFLIFVRTMFNSCFLFSKFLLKTIFVVIIFYYFYYVVSLLCPCLSFLGFVVSLCLCPCFLVYIYLTLSNKHIQMDHYFVWKNVSILFTHQFFYIDTISHWIYLKCGLVIKLDSNILPWSNFDDRVKVLIWVPIISALIDIRYVTKNDNWVLDKI